jgi:hypothetical protein
MIAGANHVCRQKAGTLYVWVERQCRYLSDKDGNPRTIEHKWVVPPVPVGGQTTVLVLLRKDLETIDAARGRKPNGEVLYQGVKYVLEAEMVKRHKVNRTSFRYWHKKESRRPGREGQPALRAERVPNPRPGTHGRTKVWGYVEEDWLAILRGEETGVRGTGQPANKRLQREARDKAAKDALRQFLSAAPVAADEVAEWARSQGIATNCLARAAKALEVNYLWGERAGRRRGYCWFWGLPGQSLPRPEHTPHQATAIAFLRETLAGGPLPLRRLKELAREKGIHADYLIRARRAAGVVSEREPHGEVRYSTWRLAEQPATFAPARQAPGGADGKYPGHQRKPYRTGRRPDPDTEAVLEFCYDWYVVKGFSRAQVLTKAKSRFPNADSLNREHDVGRNARRWATRFEPPLPLERPTSPAAP